MTVPRPSGQLPVQGSSDVLVERVLGPRTAKRLATFRDGVRYVKAGRWARFLGWLVDVVVIVLGMGVGVIVLAGVDRAAGLDKGILTLAVIAILFLVPLLYGGLCYRDGRALGAVLTGTRLVRTADGNRIGGKAPWVMLGRPFIFLKPLFFVMVLVSALDGGGPPGGSSTPSRVSVDTRATRQLRAAGIT